MEINKQSSLPELFNAFVADEMWAALSYKNASFVAEGTSLHYVNEIFKHNSDEEFEHMKELVDMAKSLDITISFNINDMIDNCTTPYIEIKSSEDTAKLVTDFIEYEKRAIEGYQIALRSESIKETPELVQFFGELCNDEHNHLQELDDCLSSISNEKKSISKPTVLIKDNIDDEKKNEKEEITDIDKNDDVEMDVIQDEDDEEGNKEDKENDKEDTDESTISESFQSNNTFSIINLYNKIF